MQDLKKQAEKIANANSRQWSKAADFLAELEEVEPHLQALVDSIDRLRNAMESKEGASEMSGEERSAELESAWDEVLCSMSDMVEAADGFNAYF